jgi:hypothetical protein
MEMEQTMTRLLAEIRTNREEMKTNKEMLTARLEAKMDFYQEELQAMLEACLEKTKARTQTGYEPGEAEIKTDLEEMKTTESVVN